MTANRNTSQSESAGNAPPKVFSVQWRRAMHGEFNDQRLPVIAKRAGVQPIVAVGMLALLLEYASSRLNERGSIEGIDIESLAFRAGLEEDVVRKLLSAFEEKGYLMDSRFVGWSDTQVLREDPGSTERSRRRREKQSADEGASRHGGAPATHGDALGTHLQRDATPEKNRADQSIAERPEQTRAEYIRAEAIRSDQSRTDQTRSEQKISEQSMELDNDSNLACGTNDSDSAGGKDIRSQSEGSIVVAPPDSDESLLAQERIPSVTDSNSSTPPISRVVPFAVNDNVLPDLTEENLSQMIPKLLGPGCVTSARELLKLSDGDSSPLLAVVRNAMSIPEPARPRALQYALDDARAAAGLEVQRAERQPVSTVTVQDFMDWTKKKLVLLGNGNALQMSLLEATGDNLPRAMTIVEGAAAQPVHERSSYLDRERRRARNIRDSESGADSDWPADYGDQFWAAYPRHIGKESTMEELRRLRKEGVSFTQILMEAENYALNSKKTDPQYVKSPINWLKKRCWPQGWERACA